MKLHEYQYEFKDLISIVASKLHIPESAVCLLYTSDAADEL